MVDGIATDAFPAGRVMSPAVVLAIIVATHNVDDQATEAMRATAAEALGGEDYVLVHEVEAPSDDEALRVERSIHAQAAAEVVWLDLARTRARVRVHVAETNRWTERTVAFSSVDTPPERGRALGFAVTSMLPEEALAANPHHGAARVPGTRAPAPGELRSSLRLAAIGSAGLGGTAGGLGGGVAGEFFIGPRALLRLGFGGRQGSVPDLDANDVAVYGGVGFAYWPLRASADTRISVGFRGDALAIYHSVARDVGGTVTRLAKWLPGVDALVEVGWGVTGSLEIMTSAGVEAALGNTELQLDDRPVDLIPRLRAVAEIGIRVSF
jgi:hypothetical protein